MTRCVSRFALLLILPWACAQGDEAGLTGLSGAYTAGPGGAETDGESGSGGAGTAGPMPGTDPLTSSGGAESTGGSDTSGGDDGNPACCQVSGL
ncbi:MAG: hypothetical protein K0V04_01020, partial [Deltaproteobacteria bacterium]|nr:hypothetical protein [Deltaproteobacteria bacterium]